jgi:hypothetical protein
MTAKFAHYSAAALLAAGLLAAPVQVLAQATSSTTPKLGAGHYLFDAYETADLSATPNCPFAEGGKYQFIFVYSSSKNSTLRFTPTDSSGSGVVIASVPKKPSSGPWDVTYTAAVYNQSGTNGGSWSGLFIANGVPADTESIAIALELTNWPDPGDATTCSPTFNASGAMTGPGS